MSKQSKPKPSPLKFVGSEEEELLSSCSSSRRSSHGSLGNLARLASRRSSLSPKLLEKKREEDFGKRSGGRRRNSNFLELPVLDYGRSNSNSTSPRTKKRASLPAAHLYSSDSDEELDESLLMYRLRSFNIKDNRVVNCGDSVLPRETRGRHSGTSTKNNSSRNSPVCCHSNNSMESLYSAASENYFFGENRFRVVMLGQTSVGKTSLVNQFMTSEYISTYDASLDDDYGERSVSVLLDNQESELIFIDHPSNEMSVENALATYSPQACIVVYSITDRDSFGFAEEILRYLWNSASGHAQAVILVGNKCDLERAREVEISEGRSLATNYSAKFIETSPGLQHNCDELLVGALKQCRLRRERRERKKFSFSFRELLRKLNSGEVKRSKSCAELFFI